MKLFFSPPVELFSSIAGCVYWGIKAYDGKIQFSSKISSFSLQVIELVTQTGLHIDSLNELNVLARLNRKLSIKL
jgi:hypothetical protein